MKTKEDITGQFYGYDVTIPKGTRVTKKAADGTDLTDGTCFIDEFSWAKHEDGTKMHGLIHDATYKGIRVKDDQVE